MLATRQMNNIYLRFFFWIYLSYYVFAIIHEHERGSSSHKSNHSELLKVADQKTSWIVNVPPTFEHRINMGSLRPMTTAEYAALLWGPMKPETLELLKKNVKNTIENTTIFYKPFTEMV